MQETQYCKTQEGIAIRLESRLKNALLVRVREKLGLSATEAAMQIGLGYQTLLEYESMKRYPPPKMQKKICDFYRDKGSFIYEEDAFPESLKQFKPRGKFVHEAVIPEEKLIALSSNLEQRLLTDSSPSEDIVKKELLDEKLKILYEALATLPERYQRVLKSRYFEGEPKTYAEIGKTIGLTRQAAREIESRALEMLRGNLIKMDKAECLKYLHEERHIPESEKYIKESQLRGELKGAIEISSKELYDSWKIKEILLRRIGIEDKGIKVRSKKPQSVYYISRLFNTSQEETKQLIERGLEAVKAEIRKRDNGEECLLYLDELLGRRKYKARRGLY